MAVVYIQIKNLASLRRRRSLHLAGLIGNNEINSNRKFDSNRYHGYLMAVVYIQIKNLTSLRRRRSLRLAGVAFLFIQI